MRGNNVYVSDISSPNAARSISANALLKTKVMRSLKHREGFTLMEMMSSTIWDLSSNPFRRNFSQINILSRA